MKAVPTITVAFLKSRFACSPKRRLFTKTFGKSAKITVNNLKKAEKVGLDLDWLFHRRSSCLRDIRPSLTDNSGYVLKGKWLTVANHLRQLYS